MPVAKPRSYDSLDAMKLGQKIVKPEEGNDSLDNFIRHAIGKEPVLSFSRAGDSPVQWIQLLHALDQQGTNKLSKGSKVNNSLEGKERSLEHFNGVSSFASGMNGVKESVHSLKTSGVHVKGTKSASEHMQTLKIPEAVAFAKANGEPEKYLSGWPLLSPPKIQMQKCDKCAREFCSSINYRRHIRVHRRSLNIDKDSSKYRNFLKAFWDTLSLDEAKDIISFKDVMLEEVPGSSIVRSLTSFIRKPGFSPLPQVHVKAGAALLDLVQSRASRFPITSQELFSILDDASERTFLCPGTAMSMQKFVFDGEPGKVGLEIKNLIACTSFLVEQKLVKAWLADKDAEALRCHKLLVEEEEAAQRRQTELLERKRLKKLRQKEQRAKEQVEVEETVLKESGPDTLEGLLSLSDTSIPLAVSNSHSDTPEATTAIRLQSSDEETDTGYLGFDNSLTDPASDHSIPTSSANCHSVDRRMQQGGRQRHLVVARRPLQNSQRVGSNGFHSSQVPPVAKLGAIQKPQGIHRDQQQGIHRDHRAAPLPNGHKAGPLPNGHKVWTRKTKPEKRIEDLNGRVRRESRNKTDQDENCEVLIGSIPVTLGNCNGRRKVSILDVALDHCNGDHQTHRLNSVQEKPVKSDSSINVSNRSTKLWRPVGRLEDKREVEEAELDVVSGKAAVDQTPMNESCLLHDATDDCSARNTTDSSTVLEEDADLRGLRSFSSHAAYAFLSQRWKEAIAADHVKLVLTVETEPPPCCPQSQQDEVQVVAPVTPECFDRNVLCSAENRLSGVKTLEPTSAANGASTKTKFRGKPEKGNKLKYIPKQRNYT